MLHCEIPLTNGRFAIIDSLDYPYLSQFNWYAVQNHGTWYARRHIKMAKNNYAKIYMHREIFRDVVLVGQIDHIDRDGLNNTRQNLRECTHTQNQLNKRLSKNNASGYKGVYFENTRKKFIAAMSVNGKRVFLGYFDDPALASIAYNTARSKVAA